MRPITRSRPWGILLLAALCVVQVAVYLVLAVLAVFSRPALDAVLHALSPSGAGPEAIHNAMGRALPFYYAVMAVVSALMAVAFWRLWNWVRLLTLGMIVPRLC